MRRAALASFLGLIAITAGCLGRTGIGSDELDSVETDDASVDTGLSIVDAPGVDSAKPSEDTLVDTGSARDTWIDIWEVFPLPIPDSGPIGACASCVRDMCGAQVNACVNSPECRTGLACTVSKCLAGGGGGGGGPGGFDLACITGCFGGDLSKAFQAISMFTCITGKCGTACGGIIGGIPGFPGGGGMGGSGGGGAKYEFTPDDMSRLPMSMTFKFAPEALSPWRHEIMKSACEQGLASCAP